MSIGLAACGGNGGVETDSATAPKVDKVAASANGSSMDSAQMSSAINENSLALDSLTDRFIVKYKDGTTERKAPSTIQSKFDRQRGTFPAKVRHLHRMGIGADVVTTDRKLNANEAKAFMRAIAADPDVEYVESDTIMSAQMVPTILNT